MKIKQSYEEFSENCDKWDKELDSDEVSKVLLIMAFILLSLVLVGSLDYRSAKDAKALINFDAWFNQPKYKGVFHD